MRVAVVGGGLFGCTVAIHAVRAGHEVHLYEANERGLMRAASTINQYRLHLGYHYPRSPETVQECRASERSFLEEYGQAVTDRGQHLYSVARNGSKVSGTDYVKFLAANHLPYVLIENEPHINGEMVDVVIGADEKRIIPHRLQAVVEAKMRQAFGHLYFKHVHIGEPAPATLRRDFDKVVIAAYAGTNQVAEELGCRQTVYQYEVVEKPIVRLLPEALGETGIVVMDGPFGCVDPRWPGGGDYVLGHVEHAIHNRNVGTEPEIPEYLADYIDGGFIREPRGTHFAEFIEAGSEYVPALRGAVHFASMFTVRTVLPDVDATDARPTMVEALDDKVIRVFAGKLSSCVDAAQQVVAQLDEDVRSGKKAAARVQPNRRSKRK